MKAEGSRMKDSRTKTEDINGGREKEKEVNSNLLSYFDMIFRLEKNNPEGVKL
ncbi:hypothetical protein SAMN06295967_102188 [Belliella buryatensis]|uniref:Uncharacterized protein n=1 Tax=Belliella buryatensis TaxID=1500549 RepID=A0A239B9Q6_9BACT|nr:hypothetical protein SAMN06295967_102188 [Belliella buryatensis]